MEQQQVDPFQFISNEVIDLFFSYLDPISFLRLGITSTRLLGLIHPSNRSWCQQYAKTYHLNEKELTYYTNVNWKVLFCNRYVNELAFAKRAVFERNKFEEQCWGGPVVEIQGLTDGDDMMQVEYPAPDHWEPIIIDVLPLPAFDPNFDHEDENDHEEIFDDDDDNDDDVYYYTEEEYTFYRKGAEFKYYPSYNPFYRLACERIRYFDQIKSIVVAILKGFRRNCKEVEEKVDVIVTFFAKYLKKYPELAEYLDPDKLGPLLYLRQDLYPDSKIAMGALSLIFDTLTTLSPEQLQIVRFVGTGDELEVVNTLKTDSPYHVHATNMLAVITNSNIDIQAIGDRLGLWDVVYDLIKKSGLKCDRDILFCGFEILLSKSFRHLKYRSDSTLRKLIVEMAKNFSPTRLNSLKYFAGVLTWPGDDQEELEDLVRIYLVGHDMQVIAQIALLKSAANSDYARKLLAGNEKFMQSLAGAIEQNANAKKYCLPLYNLLKQK